MTIGNVATEATKGLSSSPMLLLVAVINVIMVGALIYVGISQREERKELTKYLIDCQSKAAP
jgi:hypothetical protein